MRIKCINKSNISYRIYVEKNGKKYYKKNIDTKVGDIVNIHFDEMKNMNKWLLFINRLLFTLSFSDGNDKASNLIVNEDAFVVEYKCNGDDNLIFTMSENGELASNVDAMILKSDCINPNPRLRPIASIIYIILLLLILVGIIALAFYFAGGPF
ncbi:MAG: hypothetical protein K6G48_04865 [Acholeplasmatales bacterium]|nr:hypothetical protein [Acholeplasmatales bacterium]